MHFMAMLGFDVPASPVRYDPVPHRCQPRARGAHRRRRAVHRRPRPARGLRMLGGGLVHRARRASPCTTPAWPACASPATSATTRGWSPPPLVIAVVAATVALWFTVSVARLAAAITGAAVVMALAVCGMHYTGMAAMQVDLYESGQAPRRGHQPDRAARPDHPDHLGRADRHGVQRPAGDDRGGVRAAPEPPTHGGRHAETPFTVAMPPGTKPLSTI